MSPRFLHRMFAAAAGFFWLPCPLCGENFGGHEWRYVEGHTLWLGAKGLATCPRCQVESLDGPAAGHPMVFQ